MYVFYIRHTRVPVPRMKAAQAGTHVGTLLAHLGRPGIPIGDQWPLFLRQPASKFGSGTVAKRTART